MSRLPIADYALLSDCRSAALVSRDGSIDWLCFPRFDGPSVFGRLLDDAAGHWSIRPVGATHYETTRRYVDDTLVLETTFTTAGGSVTLTDALAVGRNERGHGLGAGAVGAVLRRVSGVEGSVDLELVYDAAPRVRPRLAAAGQWSTAASPHAAGPTCWRCRRRCRSRSTSSPRTLGSRCGAGEALSFALHHRTHVGGAAAPLERRRRSATGSPTPPRRGARGRACTRRTTDRGPTSCATSGRVLYGLTYFPTGAIVRRADHVAPRDAGRLAQLGLPLLVGA